MLRFNQFVRCGFAGSVVTRVQFRNVACVDIEPNRGAAFAEFYGKRKADVAEADDGDF